MKKTILSTFIIVLSTSNIYAQLDSTKQVELPATMVRDSKTSVHHPKASVQLQKAFVKRTNQGADIPMLLNSLSSVVVSSDAGNGVGYTGIRIRGADITRINVTLNGVPVNDAESQATFFVNTPDLLSSAQSIEISKGVGSSKSGVGNFGGGISLNTLDVNNTKAGLSYQVDYGSLNTLKNTLRATTGLLHDRWISTIRLSKISSDGYVDRSSSNLQALQLTSKFIIDSSSHIVFNYMKGKEKTGQAWNGVPQDSLATNRTFNELGRMSDTSFYDNQTDNYGQDYYQLFYDKTWRKKWHAGAILYYTKGKGYYEEYKQQQSFVDYNLPATYEFGDTTVSSSDIVRQLWLDNDFYGIKAYLNYFSSKLDAGLYLNHQNYIGKHFGDVVWSQYGFPLQHRWYNLNAQKQEQNAYTMLNYRFHSKLELLADMQIRNVRYEINGFRKNPSIQHDLRFLFFNPKLKLSYKTNNNRIDLLAGIAQKEPNRDDLEASTKQLPKPEKLYNLELTYFQKIGGHVAIQANGFYMYYINQLVLTGQINDVGAYARTNTPRSRRVGLELEAFYKNKWIEAAANIALSDNAIQQYSEFVDDYDNGIQLENVYRNTPISFSPSIISGARLSFFPLRQSAWKEISNMSIDILPKYVSRQFLDNTGNKYRSINPYRVLDAILAVPYTKEGIGVFTFRLGVYNVFNAQYENNGYTFSYKYDNALSTFNYYYPQAGRRFMIGAGIEL